MAQARWRIRTFMGLVVYLAVDLAAVARIDSKDAVPALAVFLILTAPVRLVAFLWWGIRRIDKSGRTLY